MTVHAATAQWLRTLRWWDWRGWSDWFFGGQAVGVNYPPLSHAWLRFTDPYHGQMAAVAIGLLVLMPWGALRLARAVGYGPRAQRAAVAAVFVLVAASTNMHWVLSGFHSERTFFSSWPAMMAIVLGLHIAAWAAEVKCPVRCGAVAGIAVLFNATVTPGIAVVCAVLLATSDASFGRALRWASTASSAALAVCAWWLVPFLAGWDRLVRWEVRLSESWTFGGTWQIVVLIVVAIGAAWTARCDAGSSRRLALASGAGLLLGVLADLAGFQRPERWLEFSILVAASAIAGLFAARGRNPALMPARPAWTIVGTAVLIVVVVVTLRLEFVPLAIWLARGSWRSWAWGGALAWTAVLALVPLWAQIRSSAPLERPATALEVASKMGGAGASGLVDLDSLYSTAAGDTRDCPWGLPWHTTVSTNGRIRPLFGIYGDTSHSAEFLLAENQLRGGGFDRSGRTRPHWFDAWDEAGRPSLDSVSRAEALGARWYAECDTHGGLVVTDLPGSMATGTALIPHIENDSWHQAAVKWWISADLGLSDVPVHRPEEGADRAYQPTQAAQGVSLRAAQDSLTVLAQEPGWAWLRVPWDPYWRSVGGTPVLKGGPGHLIVWANEGTTELRWKVPGAVDSAAAAASGIGMLITAALATVNRRRGFPTNLDRPRPTSVAVQTFAQTVDEWAHTFVRRVRRCVLRSD